MGAVANAAHLQFRVADALYALDWADAAAQRAGAFPCAGREWSRAGRAWCSAAAALERQDVLVLEAAARRRRLFFQLRLQEPCRRVSVSRDCRELWNGRLVLSART